MSGAELLRAIASGADDRLLNAVRLESGGSEAYGVEAVSAWFRLHRPDLSEAKAFETPGHAALIGETELIFADLHEGHVGRLWHLSPRRLAAAEFAISVAFDPDLRQERGSLHFDASEHRALTAEGASRARESVGGLLKDPNGAYLRSRGFVVRAFGDGERGVALCALVRVTNNSIRETGFTYAAASWDGEGVRTVFDQTWPTPAMRFEQ